MLLVKNSPSRPKVLAEVVVLMQTFPKPVNGSAVKVGVVFGDVDTVVDGPKLVDTLAPFLAYILKEYEVLATKPVTVVIPHCAAVL